MFDSLFDCKHCSEGFKSKNWLSRHLRTEHDIRTCPKCPKEFKGQLKYDSHIEEYHSELTKGVKKVKCTECDLSFTIKGLTYHYNAKHGKHKCPECSEVFSFRAKMAQHVFEKHVNFRYKCDLCSKEFQRLQNYDEHLERMHGDNSQEFKCELCDYKTSVMKYLRSHRSQAHRKTVKKFECNPCQKRFKTRGLFRIHQLNIHNAKATDKDTLYSCEYCSYTSYNKSTWKMHIQQRHSDTKFPCNLCEKSFKMIADLNKHKKRIHEGKKHLSCNHCDHRFYSKNNLTLHIKSKHTLNESIPCKICGKMLKEGGSMKSHIKEIHEKEPQAPVSKCPVCHLIVKDFEKHNILMHGNLEPNFNCPQCPKKFITNERLKIHVNTVHVDRNLKCEHCDKHFKSLKNLKRHLETHQGPEECSICHRKFNDLRRHTLRVHKNDTLERLFKCEERECEKRFKSMTDLKNHLKKHQQEPEECSICHGKFKDLRYHMKTHQEPEECPICHEKFKFLRGHLKRHYIKDQKSVQSTVEI